MVKILAIIGGITVTLVIGFGVLYGVLLVHALVTEHKKGIRQ